MRPRAGARTWEKLLRCENVAASLAGGPRRELVTNWDGAKQAAVAPLPAGSGCRRLAPAAVRATADPAVLRGHGAARKRFWGAAPWRSRSRRPGQRGAGRTPHSCLVPPGARDQRRTTPVLTGAQRSSVFADVLRMEKFRSRGSNVA